MPLSVLAMCFSVVNSLCSNISHVSARVPTAWERKYVDDMITLKRPELMP